MTALIVLGELRLLTEDSMPKDKCTTARRTTLVLPPTAVGGRLQAVPRQRLRER